MAYRTAPGGISVHVAATLVRSPHSGDEDAVLVAELHGRGAFAPPVDQVELRTGHGLVLGVFGGTGPAVSHWASAHLLQLLGAPLAAMTPAAMQRRLVEAMEETARATSAALGNGTLRGMGTTATVVVVVGSSLVLAHVGDSRAYMLRRGRVTQVSRDDTLLASILETPSPPIDVTSIDRDHLPRILVKALGMGERAAPFVETVDLRRGDRLLLCTGGVHRALVEGEIATWLGSGGRDDVAGARAACEALVERAMTVNLGLVDLGVVVASFEDPALVPPAEADVLVDWSNEALRRRAVGG